MHIDIYCNDTINVLVAMSRHTTWTSLQLPVGSRVYDISLVMFSKRLRMCISNLRNNLFLFFIDERMLCFPIF